MLIMVCDRSILSMLFMLSMLDAFNADDYGVGDGFE